MKKLFILLAAGAICSCSKEPSPKEVAQKNFEVEIKKSLNDAASYEFVEMDSLIPLKGSYMYELKGIELDLEKIGMEDTTDIAKQRSELNVYKNNPNEVYGYSSIMKIRANNKFGAKVLEDYRVTFDKEYRVTNIEE